MLHGNHPCGNLTAYSALDGARNKKLLTTNCWLYTHLNKHFPVLLAKYYHSSWFWNSSSLSLSLSLSLYSIFIFIFVVWLGIKDNLLSCTDTKIIHLLLSTSVLSYYIVCKLWWLQWNIIFTFIVSDSLFCIKCYIRGHSW